MIKEIHEQGPLLDLGNEIVDLINARCKELGANPQHFAWDWALNTLIEAILRGRMTLLQVVSNLVEAIEGEDR